MKIYKHVAGVLSLVLASTLCAESRLDINEGSEYALSAMDTDTPETKELYKRTSDKNGYFGLEAYQKNFFLPISYGKDKPPRISNSYPVGDPANPEAPFHEKNMEVEFQFSLKTQLLYNTLGWHEYVYAGYTQRAWWQAYSESAPFREINYEPELFMYIPAERNFENDMGLKAVKVGFLHQSNGHDGYQSRSWNRVYLTGMWQWGNLFMSTRAWYRIPEDDKPDGYFDGTSPGGLEPNAKGDDNPDIYNYLGYGDIKVDYLYGKAQIGLLLRNNLRMDKKNKGAVELNYTYPILNSKNTFWYVKLFHGYGESLIDYNREVSKASVGFSFSRGLF